MIHPAPRKRGGGTARSAVGGVRNPTMFPSAPANLHRRRPLHHTLCVSLPRYREGGKRSRFRGAAASELCNEAERIFSLQKKGGEASKDAPSIGRARASPDEAKRNRATTTKEKGSGTPTNVCPTSASRDAARTLSLSPPPLAGGIGRGHARLSAFHHGSCVSERTPTLSSRPGFLGLGRTLDPVSSLQPGSKDLALLRA